ncbi:MAG: hypothetical protein KIT69_09260 [Propionibacteriaceae bacterium]|nr:hypothetical protein [Propionibacteriaceae bacterium]
MLASCAFQPAAESAWGEPVTMPVSWLHRRGQGTVFACALGHDIADIEVPQTGTVIRRGLRWTSRGVGEHRRRGQWLARDRQRGLHPGAVRRVRPAPFGREPRIDPGSSDEYDQPRSKGNLGPRD